MCVFKAQWINWQWTILSPIYYRYINKLSYTDRRSYIRMLTHVRVPKEIIFIFLWKPTLFAFQYNSKIWCDFDRASSLICGTKMPTRCNRGFYCRSYCLLNMFRASLCPSSEAQEYYTVVAACGILCCVFFK